MAGKLLTMEEAAKLLGVSPSELNEMRLRQEIFASRDGSGWKFKEEEVERVRNERAGGGGDSGEYSFSLADDDEGTEPPAITEASDDNLPISLADDESDVILLSETELGDSAIASANTVIGGRTPESTGPDSDILSTGSGAGDMDSDLRLLDSGLDLSNSDVTLAHDTSSSAGDSKIFTEHTLDPDTPTILTSDVPSELGSSVKLSIDDEDVLGGSGTGSDITINPGDSGIQLVDPADSGLSLEEPLELGRADDLLDVEMLDDSALGVQEGDDFLLTPLEDADEESDSGSQVIALDTEGDFEDATATLLGSQIPGLLEEDTGALDPLGMPASGAAATAGAAAGPVTVIRSETRFSLLDVALLSICLVTLSLSGVMMYDLVRNMWSWDSPYSLNSTLMDMFVGKG